MSITNTPSNTTSENNSSKTSPKTKHSHKRYQNSEAKFKRALCQEISQRKLNVRTKDICNRAEVTAPTFYAHYHNSNDARRQYELLLEREFAELIPQAAHKNLILTILPAFVARHCQYFLAVHKSCDHYLLTKVILKYRPNLVGAKISDRNFYAYVGLMETVIACWLELEELSEATAARCTRALRQLRVPRLS